MKEVAICEKKLICQRPVGEKLWAYFNFWCIASVILTYFAKLFLYFFKILITNFNQVCIMYKKVETVRFLLTWSELVDKSPACEVTDWHWNIS